jgi:DNA primase
MGAGLQMKSTGSRAGGKLARQSSYDRDHVERLRARLGDVGAVCVALDLVIDARPQPDGLFVRCPWHNETTPSCSVRTAKNGFVYAKCFACGASGDVFALVARVRGLDARRQFAAVLAEAENIAAMNSANIADITGPSAASTEPIDDEQFDQIATALFGICTLELASDVETYLRGRGLLNEARRDGWGALPKHPARQAEVVAYVRGVVGDEVWLRAGLANPSGTFTYGEHRLLIPWRRRDGLVTTVQRRILPPKDARRPDKYVFPRGRSPNEPYGIDAIETGDAVTEVAFVEGAPDVLAMRMLDKQYCVNRIALGVPGASNWRAKWAGLAADRIAHIAFDNDPAGDAAATDVAADVYRAGAAQVLRTRARDAKDWAELIKRKSP